MAIAFRRNQERRRAQAAPAPACAGRGAQQAFAALALRLWGDSGQAFGLAAHARWLSDSAASCAGAIPQVGHAVAEAAGVEQLEPEVKIVSQRPYAASD